MAKKRIRIVQKAPKAPLFSRIRSYFLTGLIFILPIIITINLIWWFINFMDKRVMPLIPYRYSPENFGLDIPGYGVIVFVVFVTVIGYVMRGFFGRQVRSYTESLLNRVPVIRTIYGGIRQISETVLSDSRAKFEDVVLVEYPKQDSWAIAFLTKETEGEIAYRGNEPLISVFLPTTPNPTSGFLLFVPKSKVQFLDMTVEEAAKLIISAGLVEPEYPPAINIRTQSETKSNGTKTNR